MSLISRALIAFESAPLPDAVRRGAVSFLVGRVKHQLKDTPPGASAKFAQDMGNHVIAEHTADANKQHYEVPAEFFRLCLGPRFKYSSCLYKSPADTLAMAEVHALTETCANAELAEGQHILELGCGWGSMTLFMA
ncbi:MAG: SAM-dependent methyltransferase, partial [Rubrivivax sp.]